LIKPIWNRIIISYLSNGALRKTGLSLYMRDEEIGDIVESRINVKLIENRLSATCFENGLVQQIRACLRVADEILWSM